MATIAVSQVLREDGIEIATWTNLANATSDVGAKAMLSKHRTRTAQAFGTNATTVVIQGSNDGTNWNALGSGVTLTIGATGSSPVTNLPENPLYLRPSTPSAAADTDVVIVGGGGGR